MSVDIAHITKEILLQYQEEEEPRRPWIVGFSGGKDSTMLLQLVWNALSKLPSEMRNREVYVVCNNTLVENPKILKYTEGVLQDIEKASVSQSMPIYVVRTIPKLEESFWVNLIGKGYPAPNNAFRWCTERLKINPTTAFIKDKISEIGEAIILLGTRKDESSTRSKSIDKHKVTGERLRKHILPNAFVFAPIEDVLTNEVWAYLNQVQSPWGSDNKQLQALYRNANSGDCPIVIDDSTPSCGNSRFGCWVCTVVKKDKSMEALIENGEDWMEPLMEVRDILVTYRNDKEWRETRRRDGSTGEGILGPYTPAKRAHILRLLLEAQKEIKNGGHEYQLINYQELVAIQVTWYRDSIFNQSVADIYNDIFGTEFQNTDFNDQLIFEKEVLKDSCQINTGHFELINELLELQNSKTILMNNKGLHNDLERRLEQFVNKEGQR